MKKEIIKKAIILFLIIIFFEIFIFNFNTIRTYLGKYEEIEIEEPEFLYNSDDKSYLLVEALNIKTASIKIEFNDESIEKNYKESEEYVTEYSVSYSDATTDEYLYLNSKEYIISSEKSKCMPLYLSGETKGFIISVNQELYENGYLQKIIINPKEKIEINFVRVIVLYAICVFAYCFKNCEIFKEVYDKKSFKQEMILIGILSVFLIFLTFINSYSSEEENSEEASGFLKTISTDSGLYNKDFVDAIKSKCLYLLNDPSEEFKNLDNQYDPLGRDTVERDVDYRWDTAYYNGHQYVYFGILPLLALFLPYNLLTHQYLKVGVVVFGLSILILILLKEILIKLINLYYKEVPFKVVFLSLLTLFSGSLILYANGMSRVYELVIIAGLYMVLQGLYFILKSIESEEKKYFNIFLGAIFLALSVACRPTCLFVSIIILPYLIKLLIQNFKTNKKNLLKLIFVVAIPYLTVGILLMIYNYVRFDNPFDFGTQYQITINNMKELGNRLYAIPVGIMCNFFNLPNFIGVFPFISNNNELMTFYGYYYIENMIAGLFILAPICFVNLFVIKANKKIENKELKLLINISLIVGIFIAILSVAMAGSNERYIIDYAWIFILDGILIFMSLYNTLKSDESKRIISLIFGVVTIYTFLFSIASGIVSEKDYLKTNSPETYYKTRYTICFWE